MRRPIRAVALVLAAMTTAWGNAQQAPRTPDPKPPAPGSRGNPDNVPDPTRRATRSAWPKRPGTCRITARSVLALLHFARSPGHGERRAHHERR